MTDRIDLGREAWIWTERAEELLARAEDALELRARPSRAAVRLSRELCLEALRELDPASATSLAGAGRATLRSALRRLRAARRRARLAMTFAKLRQVRGRGLRLAAVVGLTLVVLTASLLLWTRVMHPNLLAGRPFRTSSSWATCDPVRAKCGGAPTRIFFHTNEELEPFIEYDLGEIRGLSRVVITNRREPGTADRALPLLVETSLDGKTWREVRRREYWFDVWQADFAKVSARYLRLKVGRRSTLHLERVQAFE